MLRCLAPGRKKVRAGYRHKGGEGAKSRTWRLSPWTLMSSQWAVGGGYRGSSGQKPSSRIASVETSMFMGLIESRGGRQWGQGGSSRLRQ